MKVLNLRIWVDFKVTGTTHNWYWDKRYENYAERPTFTNEFILECVRKHLKLDVSAMIDEVDNFGNPDFEFEGFEEYTERKYTLRLKIEKMSERDIKKVLLAMNGIKTKKLNPKKIGWDLSGTEPATGNAVKPENYGFPQEMLNYLAVTANLFKSIEGGQEGPTIIELRAASNLNTIDVEFWAEDTHTAITKDFFNNDPNRENDDKMYRFTGIDLVRQNDLYPSEGLLIWIPELTKFGTYDPEHQNLVVFPDAKPKDIFGNFGKYIAAQWQYGNDYLVKCGNIYDYYEPWKYFEFS